MTNPEGLALFGVIAVTALMVAGLAGALGTLALAWYASKFKLSCIEHEK